MDKRTKQQVAKLIIGKRCLACGQPLDGTRPIRGCHERCYRAAVRSHESLDRFVEAGRMLPANPGGRPKGSTKQWIAEVLHGKD